MREIFPSLSTNGQTPGEVVQIVDVAEGRSQKRPHHGDVTPLPVAASNLAAGFRLLEVQLRQGHTGDNAGDISVVVDYGQTPGEVVQVGEIAEGRSQERPHHSDVTQLEAQLEALPEAPLPVSAGDLAAGLRLLKNVAHASPPPGAIGTGPGRIAQERNSAKVAPATIRAMLPSWSRSVKSWARSSRSAKSPNLARRSVRIAST